MPATAEELAAAQRSDQARGRRSMLIGVGAAVALVFVAGGWVIAGRGPADPLAASTPTARPAVAHVDGFGAGSPSPSTSIEPTALPVTTAPSSPRPVVTTTGLPRSAAAQFTATIVTKYWDQGLQVDVTIVNNGSQPLVWQLDLEVSPRVNVRDPWNSVLAERADDRVRLVAPTSYGPLEPGQSVKAGFIGEWDDRASKHVIFGCEVNGWACTGL